MIRPHSPVMRLALLGATLMLLTACADRDGASAERSILERATLNDGGPDEFQVIPRAPLIIPPSLSGALPTPQADAPSRIDRNSQDAVREIFANAGAAADVPANAGSAGEQMLLATVATPAQTGNIRALVTAENDALQAEERQTLTQVLFGQSLFNLYSDQILNAGIELYRLREEYPNALTPAFNPETATDPDIRGR